MKKRLLVIVIFISHQIFGAEKIISKGLTPFQFTAKIERMLEQVKSLTPDEFLQNMNSVRQELELYLEHKRGVCNGEYSTMILEDDLGKQRLSNTELDKKEVYNLTKNERDLCFGELKAIQVTYINNLFVARTRLLEFVYKKRMDELSKARASAIESIQDTFNKKRVN